MDRRRESGSSIAKNGASSARRESEDSIGENGASSARRESHDSIGENGAGALSARRESEGLIGGNGASSVTRSGSPTNDFLNGQCHSEQSAPDVPSEIPSPEVPSPQHSVASTSTDSAIVLSARSPDKPIKPLSPVVVIVNERQPSTSRAAVEEDFRRTQMSDQDRLRYKRDSEFIEPQPFSVAAGLLMNLCVFVPACPERVAGQTVDMRRVNSDGEIEEFEDQIPHDGVRAEIAYRRETATICISLNFILAVIAIVTIGGAIVSVIVLSQPSKDKPSDSGRYPDAHQ